MLSWLSSLFSFSPRDPTSVARRKAFSDIFAAKLWGEGESISGPGSGVDRASLFRTDFELLLRELGVRTLLDAGCGDFNWLPSFDLKGIKVIGIDIVPELVSANQKRHPGVHFRAADIVTDALPKADLILCRDALVHLSNDDIFRALANFRRSEAKWLLTNTFMGRDKNEDIPTGEWRPLNLSLPPFFLPEPSKPHQEMCFRRNSNLRVRIEHKSKKRRARAGYTDNDWHRGWHVFQKLDGSERQSFRHGQLG